MKCSRDLIFRCQLFFSLCLAFAVMSPIEVISQDRTVLRVIVISEEDGTPIIGANVLLLEDESPDAELIAAGVSNRDGFHEFDRLKESTYFLQVSFIGHETFSEHITIEEGDRKINRVVLHYTQEEFEEVVVESQRHITTGEVGVRRISSTDIARIPTPGAGGDLMAYIQSLPGVVSGGDRGGDLFIRGGTPSQNYILIDNIQVIKPFHISNLFSAFPTDMIQSADLYAGGFGAEFLGGTSSVLDVSLRPGSMRNHRGRAAISPFMMALQYEGPSRKDSQSLLINSRFSTMQRSSNFLTGEEMPVEFHDLTARYTVLENDFTCNFTGVRTYDQGQIDPRRDMNFTWSNTLFGTRCFGYDQQFNYPIDVTIGFMNYNNSQGTGEVKETSSSVKDIFFRFVHTEEILGQTFDYGFGTKFRLYDTELAERFADFRSFSARRAIVHSFVALDLNPATGFILEPSLGTQLTLESVPTFEPRLRAAYSWGDAHNHEISAAAGYYYQVMEGLTDERDAGTVFTVWRPSELGEPLQNSLHGIVGYQFTSGDLNLNIEGYVKNHKNIPVSKWTPLARIEIETGLAEGFTYGFDTGVRFIATSFYGYVGYGYSFVEYQAASGDLGAWVEESIFRYHPPHDQRHKLNVVGNYEFGGFNLSAGWEFGSGRPYTGVYGFDLSLNIISQHPMSHAGTARTFFSKPYDKRLPAYHRLDISLNREFFLMSGLKVEAELGAINIYDRENIFYYDLNSLQRVDQSPLMPYLSLQVMIN